MKLYDQRRVPFESCAFHTFCIGIELVSWIYGVFLVYFLNWDKSTLYILCTLKGVSGVEVGKLNSFIRSTIFAMYSSKVIVVHS